MRDIRFRTWYKSKMTNLGHVYEAYFMDCAYLERSGHEGDEDPVLMQFTGLTDKNGNLIYEGDILRAGDDSFYGLVYFDEKDAVFGVKVYKDGKKVMNCASVRSFIVQREISQLGSHCVVIGNKFEDKHLIEND